MPTRSGWGVLACGTLFVVAGRLFGAIEFLLVGLVAVSAVALSAVLRSLRPSRVSVARQLTPPKVAAGETARVDLVVTNRRRWRSPVLSLHDAVAGSRGVDLAFAPIPGEGQVHGAYRLPGTRRGVLELGPIRVTDNDGLGMTRRVHHFETRARLLVHPPIEQLPLRRIPAGDDPLIGEELRQSLGLSDEEFDGLREYVPGDDLRKIHWPSSARLGELQVRQFRPPRHGRLSIVIDTRPPGDDAAAIDVTSSIAASIAAATLAAGDATCIETTDGRSTPLVSGTAQLDSLLEFLALLEGGSPRFDPSVPTTGGTVVAVSADPTVATDRERRRELARRLRAVVVVTVDRDRWDMGHADGAQSSGEWIHLTGPGQLPRHWTLGQAVGLAGAR